MRLPTPRDEDVLRRSAVRISQFGRNDGVGLLSLHFLQLWRIASKASTTPFHCSTRLIAISYCMTPQIRGFCALTKPYPRRRASPTANARPTPVSSTVAGSGMDVSVSAVALVKSTSNPVGFVFGGVLWQVSFVT